MEADDKNNNKYGLVDEVKKINPRPSKEVIEIYELFETIVKKMGAIPVDERNKIQMFFYLGHIETSRRQGYLNLVGGEASEALACMKNSIRRAVKVSSLITKSMN